MRGTEERPTVVSNGILAFRSRINVYRISCALLYLISAIIIVAEIVTLSFLPSPDFPQIFMIVGVVTLLDAVCLTLLLVRQTDSWMKVIIYANNVLFGLLCVTLTCSVVFFSRCVLIHKWSGCIVSAWDDRCHLNVFGDWPVVASAHWTTFVEAELMMLMGKSLLTSIVLVPGITATVYISFLSFSHMYMSEETPRRKLAEDDPTRSLSNQSDSQSYLPHLQRIRVLHNPETFYDTTSNSISQTPIA